MRRLLGILFAAWALSPAEAGACGLSGPWYVSSEDGYTGIFIVEKVIDDANSEARLSVFSPVGESALEACRVLRSDKVVIYCEIIFANAFFSGGRAISCSKRDWKGQRSRPGTQLLPHYDPVGMHPSC
jgi:hypothetical protein